MHINYDKTSYMFLGTTHKLNNSHQYDLRIDNKPNKNTHNQKLLGIYIDDKLSWCAHIDYLCSAVSSKISLLRQLSRYVSVDVCPKEVLSRIHLTFIRLWICCVCVCVCAGVEGGGSGGGGGELLPQRTG